VGIKIGARIAVVDSTSPGSQNLEGYATRVVVLPQVRLASGGSYGHSPRVMDAYSTNLPIAADDRPTSLHCSNLTSWHTSLRQTSPVSFSRKETGARTAAASHIVQGLAATLFVTIGLTNPIRCHPQ